MKAYRIVQWDRHENAESRRIRNLEWLSIPNKHDGLGFRMVARAADREALYGAWVTMLQVASRSDRSRRGWLVRNGRALGPEDMALMTGFREKYYARAFEFFQQPSLQWLELAECELIDEQNAGIAEQNARLQGVPGQPLGVPGQSAAMAGDVSRSLGTKGREGKGREVPEKKNRGGVDGAAVKASVTQFAALNARVKELEKRESEHELVGEERQELREKKARLRKLQADQADGKFSVSVT